jgi:electron transfer flavoprotein alpha/beta subunit
MDPLTEKPERVAFIAYNIGVYESIQKFASLILSGKISNDLDTNKIAQLLSETLTFYDAELISQLINVLLGNNLKSIIKRIDTNEVNYVMNQLRACGVSLP